MNLIKASDGTIIKTLHKQIENRGKATVIVPVTAPTGSDCRFSVTGGSSATLLTPSLKFRVKGAVSTTAGTNPDCQFESPGYKLENDNAPAVAGAKYLVMWTFNAARVAAGP